MRALCYVPIESSRAERTNYTKVEGRRFTYVAANERTPGAAKQADRVQVS